MATEEPERELLSCNDAKNELVFRLRGFRNFGAAYHVVAQEHTFQSARKMVRTNQNWLLRLLPLRDTRFETEESLKRSIAESAASEPLQTEVITVVTGDEDEWTSEHEQILAKLLLNWNEVRETVRNAAFRQFQFHRSERMEVKGNDPEFAVVFPDTQDPSAIEDLFSITQMEIYDDGAIRVSGPCLWDDEHGFECELGGIQDAAQGEEADAG